tara:strand:+ start:146 stop:331 length:186 start_codon:yes stop_codon:yes gene_type:complete
MVNLNYSQMDAHYKTYNLKLSEEAYFKLKQIELFFEKKKKEKLTSGQVINELVKEYEIKKT